MLCPMPVTRISFSLGISPTLGLLVVGVGAVVVEEAEVEGASVMLLLAMGVEVPEALHIHTEGGKSELWSHWTIHGGQKLDHSQWTKLDHSQWTETRPVMVDRKWTIHGGQNWTIHSGQKLDQPWWTETGPFTVDRN